MPMKVRAFWRYMAEDRSQYIALLEESEGLLDLVESLPEVLDQVFVNVESQVATAEAALQRVDLSIEDALFYTVNIEACALNNLVCMWLNSFSQVANSLWLDLEYAHHERFRHLVEAIAAFSGDPMLHAQAVAIWSAPHLPAKARVTVRLKT